jgi:hypothetical protein
VARGMQPAPLPVRRRVALNGGTQAIGAGTLSMDQKIRDYVRARFAFRYVDVDDYATAMTLENAVKAGDLGEVPHLNP